MTRGSQLRRRGRKEGYAGAADWPGAGVGASTRDMNPSQDSLLQRVPATGTWEKTTTHTHYSLSEGIDYALLSVSLGQPALPPPSRPTVHRLPDLQRTLLSRLTTFTHLRPEQASSCFSLSLTWSLKRCVCPVPAASPCSPLHSNSCPMTCGLLCRRSAAATSASSPTSLSPLQVNYIHIDLPRTTCFLNHSEPP